MFRSLVEEHLDGTVPHPEIKTIQARLDFRDLGGRSLDEVVREAVVREFHFSRNHEKLPMLARVLGRELDPETVQFQKRHIFIRNVLEHAGGVIRSEDLVGLGREGGTIRLLDAHHGWVELGAGDRVPLSIWEVLRVIRHFGELAQALVESEGHEG